ncbi:SDR family NAD(P)-dependent oxidoreductase [Alkalihalobacillus sp. CinArs1]|uniref:SDR family NAD(P)-dependent oxidoreductase n=1 Tax=Alkalihalobacillus sp. CinArs1 TaxID=2995314 RepID=UPI0022DD7E25|nr:SDR family oxidoreductase [Alkalihalobacillus sp. CinArs1]
MKTALITGASTGIGKQFAYTLAEKGLNVILVSRTKEKLDRIADDLKKTYNVQAIVIPKDLSIEGNAQEVYDNVHSMGFTVDMLINNAGAGTTGELLEKTVEKNHQQVMLNVTSVVDLTHLFLKDMVSKGKGEIINISSMAAFQPIPYMSIYAATKAFVLSFSEALHEEYKEKGIHVMAVCPGNTETEFFNEAPDAIKAGKMRTSKQVVDTTLRGLKKGKSSIIDGRMNVATSFLPRLLPRKTVTKISSSLMKKSMKN